MGCRTAGRTVDGVPDVHTHEGEVAGCLTSTHTTFRVLGCTHRIVPAIFYIHIIRYILTLNVHNINCCCCKIRLYFIGSHAALHSVTACTGPLGARLRLHLHAGWLPLTISWLDTPS